MKKRQAIKHCNALLKNKALQRVFQIVFHIIFIKTHDFRDSRLIELNFASKINLGSLSY